MLVAAVATALLALPLKPHSNSTAAEDVLKTLRQKASQLRLSAAAATGKSAAPSEDHLSEQREALAGELATLSDHMRAFSTANEEALHSEKARVHYLERALRERDAELALARPKLAAFTAEADSQTEELKSVEALNAKLKERLSKLTRSLGPADGSLEPAQPLEWADGAAAER